MNALLYYSKLSLHPNHYYKYVGWIILGIAGGALAFPLSFLSGSNVVMGFCLFPFVLFTDGKQRVNYLYLVAIAVLGTVACIYTVRTLFFFSLAFYILFLLELVLGKINSLVVFLLAFMSPFFHQVVVILGFPIRLQLSGWAGKILSLTGLNIQVEGNVMLLEGHAFSVDEACMGLNMLATSLLMGVFLIAHQYHTRKHKLNFISLTTFFLVVLLLNIVSNLLRIVMLVLFRIGPEHPMHEATGILCLLVYVIIPLYFLGRWMMSKFGRPFSTESQNIRLSIRWRVFITILAITAIGTGWRIRQEKTIVTIQHAQVHLAGYKPATMENGIAKMFNNKTLVYVKPIPEFFSGEHTPLLCWKGSGYAFKSIKTVYVNGHQIYCGRLEKPGAVFYTAWWYSNGKIDTIDQMTWRLQMLKGEPDFCLINVTTSNEADLLGELHRIFKENAFSITQ